MGATNLGDQLIYFRYNQPLISSDLGKLLHNIIKPGVYYGGLMSITSGNVISIGVLDVMCETSSNQVVHIKTQSVVPLTIAEATPYVVCNFTWVDSTSNYLDFTAKAYGDILANDVILGKGVYVANILTSFSYTKKTWGKIVSDVFTPKIAGSTYEGSGVYITQKGKYEKIDNVVLFDIDVSITSHTGSGTLLISDLPFTSAIDIDSPCTILADSLTYSGTHICGIVNSGTNTISLKQFSSGYNSLTNSKIISTISA